MKRADLHDLFARERDAFAEAFPDVADARLRVVGQRCPHGGTRCARRDLAYADWDALEVVLAERALRLPRANVLGLLRHELGHLADPTPEARGAEQRADDIAQSVTGRKIRYDARMIQTVGPGTYPRPRQLHR